MSIQQLMTDARKLRDEYDELNKQLKAIDKAKRAVDVKILEHLKEQGVDKLSVDGNTAIRGEQKVANVTDWDAFYDYIKKKDAFYLLQRRVSNNAAIEIIELDETLPGVEMQKLDKLGYRRA